MGSGAGPAAAEGVEDWPSGRAVAALFELGEPIGPMSTVPRAWSNRVFRLRTEAGTFAVKEMRNPWGDPRWEESLEAAWAVELAARHAGISMPEPVANPDDGGPLGWVPRLGGGQAPVRVHRWVEGRPAGPAPVRPTLASWAGVVLARLHSLELAVDEPDLYPAPHFTAPGEWSRLRAAAIGARAPWAIHLAAVDPLLGRIARLGRADSARRDEAVMTHGDLDTKNIVISAGGGPHLCDWDVAGPWRPSGELVDVALSLGGWSDFGVSRAVLGAYSGAGGRVPRFRPEDLGLSLTKSLDWLVFNIERGIGLRPAPPETVQMASDLVPGLVRGLIRGLEVAEAITDLLRP